ncbi:MAG: SUMF1/EgtB/PvdO family nonheme iron enzyme [Spirochaetales bacterium]|nr:SUMF1/EgtB/PvdO family nonheme iron enzyme [Spirochaetales bacterium]
MPGNHDVDRSEIKDWHVKGFYSFASQEDIVKTLRDRDSFPILMRKFKEFNSFANIVSGRTLFDDNNYFYVKHLPIRKADKSFSLNLFGLNSALFAGYDGDENRKLAISLYQLENALQLKDKTGLFSFAFFHHPFSCFHPAETPVINMLKNKMDILFHGHIHEPQNTCTFDGAGNSMTIGAGAGFEQRESENSFNIIDINPEDGKGFVQFYKYLHKHNCFRINYDVNPHRSDGRFPFTLDVKKKSNAIITVAGPAIKVDENLPDYLAWILDECGFIDIRGVMVGSGRVHKFRIDELYIPLTTTNHRGDEKERLHTDAMIESRGEVPLSHLLSHQYVTIIGDPGSGKTTFLQYIAAVLARAIREDDPDIAKTELGLGGLLLPIFIRVSELSEYILSSRNGEHETPLVETEGTWITHYLEYKNKTVNWGLSPGFFREKLKNGGCLVLFDGLDEAPDRTIRERVSSMVTNAIRANRKCHVICTTRPQTHSGKAILPDFEEFTIAPLPEKGIHDFLTLWSRALFSEHLLDSSCEKYFSALSGALHDSPAIRRLALNPLMLTALAVIHWNERRLPEQRAELYESVITWLLRSREHKPGRSPVEQRENILQCLALAMQTHPGGRQVQAGRKWACEKTASCFPGSTQQEQYFRAGEFIAREEIDSGVIVERGNNIAFRHLTFQEYLCAKALGGKADAEQLDLLLTDAILESPEWKEVLLLFCGVLYKQGLDKIDKFFTALLKKEEDRQELKDKARFFGLLGAMEQDLSPYGYKINDPAYTRLKTEVMAIFDKNKAYTIPVKVRSDAADALGQAGDPRLAGDHFVTIPACTFLMGAQSDDPDAPNYDPGAFIHESPVHKVNLTSYKIGKYPVTVYEYGRFVSNGGYSMKEYWKAGGFGEFTGPENWEIQMQFPTRPVVGVSWFEAMAYAAWLGPEYSLPREAQWERAARGPGSNYRKYPWGNTEPEPETTNWYKTGLGHPSAVGMFPRNVTDEGVFDLGGNVLEWCFDWFDVQWNNEKSVFYRQTEGATDPLNDEGGEQGKIGKQQTRVLRGGAWSGNVDRVLRSCIRSDGRPHIRDNYVGFRVVCFASE